MIIKRFLQNLPNTIATKTKFPSLKKQNKKPNDGNSSQNELNDKMKKDEKKMKESIEKAVENMMKRTD